MVSGESTKPIAIKVEISLLSNEKPTLEELMQLFANKGIFLAEVIIKLNPMFLVVLLIIVVLGFIVVGMYNGLVRQRNKVDEAWGNIQVQLKRRFDLIPNLVETVKGYASHEKETFERLVQARNSAIQVQPNDVEGQAQAQSVVSGALRNVLAVVESYPELKANTNFQQLQSALSEVEDNLQMSRRYYQATVRDFNNKCETFPSVIFANLFGFQRRPFFELENPEEAENVKVKF